MKKSDYLPYFAGKKITVMGLGLLGRGLGDAKFLAECGAILTVTELKTAKQLKTSVESLNKFISHRHLKPITYHLGGHRLEDFQNCDVVVKNADVKPDSMFIAEARKNNIPIKMSTSWFAKIAMGNGVKIIGITGTRGKSTVTQLIYEILKSHQGLPFSPGSLRVVLGGQIFLGGNVRGVATLPLLKKVRAGDVVVMELDSWQLQGFGEEKISPQVAVFTTFYPDHLNYYKGDMKKYFADKANIYKNQKAGDVLIAGKQVKIPKGPPFRTCSDLPKSWKLKIPGEHNRYNAALAVATTQRLGVPEKIIKKVVEDFTGVAGRLELVRTWRGRKIYNDTTATTPEATLAALKALSPRFHSGQEKNIILILGGADKSLDMSELVKNLPKYCREIILLPGTGTEKLIQTQGLSLDPGFLRRDLKEAVAEAIKISQSGDIILFSPAFASFGPPPGGFKNEFDRGDKFNKLVKKLK